MSKMSRKGILSKYNKKENDSFLRDQRGMATIEMSFLIPFVLIFILSIFYSIFYQLDRDIAESVLSEEMIRVSDVVKNSGKAESGKYKLLDLNNRELFYMLKKEYPKLQEETIVTIRRELERRLLLSRISALHLEVKNKESEGEVKIQMTPSISFLRTILGAKRSWAYKLKITHAEGAEEIRRFDSIE